MLNHGQCGYSLGGLGLFTAEEVKAASNYNRNYSGTAEGATDYSAGIRGIFAGLGRAW